MTNKSERAINRARKQIAGIRAALNSIDYLCSGTLLKRMMKCGKVGCRCAKDTNARHGPYFEWGHMVEGKLVHRMVSAEQAAKLQLAIENYRKVKKLMLAWERETVKLIDLETMRKP
jgi:hypothetical protein